MSRTQREFTGNIGRPQPDLDAYSSGFNGVGIGDNANDSTAFESESLSDVNDLTSAWSAVDGFPDSFWMGFDASGALHNQSLGTSLTGLTSLEFNNDLSSVNASPNFNSYSDSSMNTEPSHPQLDGRVGLHSAMMSPPANASHECSREAYETLSNLSLLDATRTHPIASITPGSASLVAKTTPSVPFDQILQINREASERTSRLLACSCARYPHLTLQYASIIALILHWYQQAAGDTQGTPEGLMVSSGDTNLSHRIRPRSISESVSGPQSPWSSGATTTINSTNTTSTPMGPGTPTRSVAPTQIAMGSFNIDDQQVQTALTIQLLLGEIRRTGRLIDIFSSRGTTNIQDFAFSGVDSLYKTLSSWLKLEHSRVTDLMKSRLKEVST